MHSKLVWFRPRTRMSLRRWAATFPRRTSTFRNCLAPVSHCAVHADTRHHNLALEHVISSSSHASKGALLLDEYVLDRFGAPASWNRIRSPYQIFLSAVVIQHAFYGQSALLHACFSFYWCMMAPVRHAARLLEVVSAFKLVCPAW